MTICTEYAIELPRWYRGWSHENSAMNDKSRTPFNLSDSTCAAIEEMAASKHTWYRHLSIVLGGMCTSPWEWCEQSTGRKRSWEKPTTSDVEAESTMIVQGTKHNSAVRDPSVGCFRPQGQDAVEASLCLLNAVIKIAQLPVEGSREPRLHRRLSRALTRLSVARTLATNL